ncbi:MAG: Tad domain-containing protein [Bacteriovoracaceae bacterium]|nr:Tad domain-containing protein [Bacteriovoracaceae bacterium]
MKKREEGQLTVFLGISLMIVITLLAFIINVGLFVKAKINLQNAVDAAAWSGAAVQSRQLSNIAYLNWEMRNTYKEWMFKYYVLGQISLKKIKNLDSAPAGDTAAVYGYYWQKHPNQMNFRMVPFWKPNQSPYYKADIYDKYNIPSICVSFSQTHNICEIYAVPGLPRFETNGLMGVSEHNEAFLNNIVRQKSKDCSDRTSLNFSVAMNWAYGTGSVTFQGAPEIGTDRIGSWVQAVELAIRIRNLEAIVNRAPIDMPICASGTGCLDVNTLEGTPVPINERPIKAFWSAFRNLGGDANEQNDLKNSFKLTELAPTPYSPAGSSLSSLLIPPSREIAGTGGLASQKYYLDLIPMPLNLATLFTTFSPTTEASFGGGSVPSEASCLGTKAAVPVPGYLFGFIKNPQVITYYSVKGEVNFMGLFFPFVSDGIKMKAYGTAKPFGGRIGPKLFGFSGQQGITPNNGTDSGQLRSAPYISGLDLKGDDSYEPGDILPTVQDFWVKNAGSDNVGGIPGSSIAKYAIPNILYDIPPSSDSSSLDHHVDAISYIMTLIPAMNEPMSQTPSINESLGLYDKKQFREFYRNLQIGSGAVDVTPSMVSAAMERVRAPTKYEALNYLIPTYEDPGDSTTGGFDSIPVVNNTSSDPSKISYEIYAPLYGPGTLYDNPEQIKSVIYQYIRSNEPSIMTYLDALKSARDNLVTQSSKTESKSAYLDASDVIWKEPTTDCTSIAGRFYTFFMTDTPPSQANCMINTLSNSISEYISNVANPRFADYYSSSYQAPASNASIMTAYMPGPRQGAAEDGKMTHSFNIGSPLRSKRNFYSTKFIATDKITNTSISGYNEAGVYSEKSSLGAPSEDFKNSLDAGQLSEFGELTH